MFAAGGVVGFMKNHADNRSLRILLIGSLPPPLGGTSVSFRNLVDSLKAINNISITVLNTGKIRGNVCNFIYRFTDFLIKATVKAARVDVISLHVNLMPLSIIGPYFVLLAKIMKKPIVIRRFNGRNHTSCPWLMYKSIDWTIRHADLYLVQTKTNISVANSLGIDKVEWFPTSRKSVVSGSFSKTRAQCRKFVFLSHVRPDKGIPEILSAASQSGFPASVHIYGPLLPGVDIDDINACSNVEYRGVVAPDDIFDVLQQYDALLLPTYCEGEGYPGVILEAFGVGIPVIATNWGGIPEIVDESCGMLVTPKSTEALSAAISKLCADDNFYLQLCAGAVARQKLFDLDKWTGRYVELCHSLVSD